MTKDEKQQFTFRITQANSTEMIVILYEMLLCYLKEAEEAVEKEDKAAFHEAVRKARGCMNELLQSLHLEYEPAPPCSSFIFSVSADWQREKPISRLPHCRRLKK